MDYNILDFNARCGDELQTEAIQKAIDSCFLAGGGRVIIPAGVFRTGGLRLRSNVELYLCSGAYLEGSSDPMDYYSCQQDTLEPVDVKPYEGLHYTLDPFSQWSNGLIKAYRAKNIAITGEPGSFFDGSDCFDPIGEESYRGPHLVNFHECENITLRGYTMRRSGNWGHAIFRSRNITVENITVYGGHDGVDVRSCDHVRIANCTFITGDDCVAGFDNIDVQVRDCYCESSCSVFRFGGTDVLIERIRSKSPAGYGFRGSLTKEEKQRSARTHSGNRHRNRTPFLYFCDFRADIRRTPGNILVRDCVFEHSNTIFLMPFNEQKWCCNKPLANIKFQNCQFTDVCEPALIHGGDETPVVFELEDVTVTAREGFEDIAFADATHFSGIHIKNISVQNFRDPVIFTDGSGILDAPDTGITLRQKAE